MDSLSWLQVCGEGQTEGCIPTIQVIYLIAVIVGVVLVAIVGRRSRDLSTLDAVAHARGDRDQHRRRRDRRVHCACRSTSTRSGPCSSACSPGRGQAP